MPLYLTGVETIMSQVARLMEQVPDFTAQGVHDAAIDIGSRASDRAPIESGDLRGNCNTDGIFTEDDTVIAEVKFTLPYAAAQHEHVEYRHPKGGEAKYLERAALEKADEVRAIVAEQLSQLFGGG